MKKILIFIDEDFKETPAASLKGLSTNLLIDSLVGTVIGLKSVEEAPEKEYSISVGKGNALQVVENPTVKGLRDGIDSLIEELKPRIGVTHIARIIHESLESLKKI